MHLISSDSHLSKQIITRYGMRKHGDKEETDNVGGNWNSVYAGNDILSSSPQKTVVEKPRARP
jgi:hypothetical protein